MRYQAETWDCSLTFFVFPFHQLDTCLQYVPQIPSYWSSSLKPGALISFPPLYLQYQAVGRRGQKKGMWIYGKFWDHRTGKGQFSFQSLRKVMPKNDQSAIQLHSSHALAEQCSKFSKLGSNITLNENYQIFQLDLKKAKEPEIKLPTSVGSYKKQENFRKTSTSALLTMPKPLTVWITTNWKILKEMRIADHLTCLLRNLYAGQQATVRTRHGAMAWFKIGRGAWHCTLCTVALLR